MSLCEQMIQPVSQKPVVDEILRKEKAVISELRHKVDGKEGKFVKVTGRSKNNNSHDRTKKSKSSKSEENSNHDRPFSSSRNNAAEISSGRQLKSNQVKSRNCQKVSQNQQTKSRSRSADPHGQSQWVLRRPDRDVPDSFQRHHHPRDSWDSDSDISDDNSWTLEPETRSRSRDSRSRSRSQVRETHQRHHDISSGQGQRYSVVTHRPR